MAACLLPTNLTLQLPRRNQLMDMEKCEELQTELGYCWIGSEEGAVELFVKPGGTDALKSHLHTTSAPMSPS